MGDIFEVFENEQLVPCIVQDWNTGKILTLAYMNKEALICTQETGEMHFWSRSRNELWHKGETSGNTQKVIALRYDCDADAILALVIPRGPICHTGEFSCFFQGDLKRAPFEVLSELEELVEQRDLERPANSYTTQLLSDPQKAGLKVIEEAEEVVAAAREESDDRVVQEAADLLYHLTVLLRSRKLTFSEVYKVLNERRK